MVAIEVGQDEQVDPPDAEQVETRSEPLGVVAGVHESDARAVPAEQHRITLPDVAGGDRPVVGESCPDDEPWHGDDHDPDQHEDPGEQQQAGPGRPRHEDRHGDARTHDACGEDPAHTTRPRHRSERERRRAVRHATDRRRRHPGHPRQHRRTPRPDRCRQTRRESDHRHDRGERLGEQVRRDRVGRQRRGQRDRHRPARELRGDRDREHRSERRPQAPREQRRERRPEDHDPARGEHGQGERERPRVPGVDHEHPDRGEGDQGDAPDRPTRQVDDEHHDGHHRCTDDRGIGPDEHHEREQEHDRHAGTDNPWQSQGPPADDHQPDDHRAVRAGHRGEVRQCRGLHRRLGLSVQPAPIADRQTPQQRTAGLREPLCHRDERLARPIGEREQSGRWDSDGRSADERHERRRAPRFVGLQGGRALHRRSSRYRATADSGRDQPDGHPQPVRVAGTLEGPDHGPVALDEIPAEDDRHRHRSRAVRVQR